ncbi:MAG: hypothetical protein AB8B55_10285 [Mariniblastus sp.]
MARRRFRLNSLSRYTKQSDRLTLDTYSAGCGGIVIRWRDPNGGMPIRFYFASTAHLKTYLDGHPIRSSVMITPGEHILAIQCSRSTRASYGSGPTSDLKAIGMQILTNYPDSNRDIVDGFGSNTNWVHETVDTSSPKTEEVPDWAARSFDESNWEPMEEARNPTREENWSLHHIAEQGTTLLTLPDVEEVRIRYRFTWERTQ